MRSYDASMQDADRSCQAPRLARGYFPCDSRASPLNVLACGTVSYVPIRETSIHENDKISQCLEPQPDALALVHSISCISLSSFPSVCLTQSFPSCIVKTPVGPEPRLQESCRLLGSENLLPMIVQSGAEHVIRQRPPVRLKP